VLTQYFFRHKAKGRDKLVQGHGEGVKIVVHFDNYDVNGELISRACLEAEVWVDTTPSTVLVVC
jgi:hypothetical protein